MYTECIYVWSLYYTSCILGSHYNVLVGNVSACVNLCLLTVLNICALCNAVFTSHHHRMMAAFCLEVRNTVLLQYFDAVVWGTGKDKGSKMQGQGFVC